MKESESTQPNGTEDNINSAINYCIRLLARREYSQKELQTKLKQQGFTESIITKCFQHLTDNNYQSDTRFTEMFTRTRVNQRYGAKKIQYELLQKGITEKIAKEAIASHNDVFLDSAQQLILRKILKQDIAAIKHDWKLKQKITRFLIGRGYDYDTINCAFEILQSKE